MAKCIFEIESKDAGEWAQIGTIGELLGTGGGVATHAQQTTAPAGNSTAQKTEKVDEVTGYPIPAGAAPKETTLSKLYKEGCELDEDGTRSTVTEFLDKVGAKLVKNLKADHRKILKHLLTEFIEKAKTQEPENAEASDPEPENPFG